MQDSIQIPDEDRRNQIEEEIGSLKRALDSVEEVESDRAFTTAQNGINDAIEMLEGELEDAPEWDRQLVKELVLDHAGNHDTTTERVDTEVVLRFEMETANGPKEFRYAVAVASGNEWFHVRRNGNWAEVWRN